MRFRGLTDFGGLGCKLSIASTLVADALWSKFGHIPLLAICNMKWIVDYLDRLANIRRICTVGLISPDQDICIDGDGMVHYHSGL